MNRYFDSDKNFICPDIVLSDSIIGNVKSNKRKNLVFCVRKDKESALSENQLENIIKVVDDSSVVFTDTQINKNRMSNEERKIELDKLLNLFCNSKLVITDRLHGMILCAITNTPCLALDNRNGKVSGVYERWLKGKCSVNLVKPDDITKELINETINLNKRYKPSKNDFQKIIELVANEHA